MPVRAHGAAISRVRSLLPLAPWVLWALWALCAGCLPKPAPACARYVDCQAAYDAAAGHAPKDTSAYAENGACWADGATAARCEPECEEGLAALATAAQAGALDVPACAR